MELLIQLGRQSLAGLILFIPSECMKAVVVGVNAFFDLPREMKGSLRSMVVIDGFGGMGFQEASTRSRPIETVVFSTINDGSIA